MSDLQIYQRQRVSIGEVKTTLTAKVKVKFISFLQTLQSRNILFEDDIELVENAFKVLEQSLSVEKTIKQLEKFSHQSKENPEMFLKIDNALAKNRSLFSRLVNSHNTLLQGFLVSPLNKIKAVESMVKNTTKEDTTNPILNVLRKD